MEWWIQITEHPTARWTAQQVVEACPWDTAPWFLLRDRDGVYGADFRRRVQSMGIEEVIIAAKSPWRSPNVERMIGNIRCEFLDNVVVLSERHLRRIQSLEMDCPEPRPLWPLEVGEVVEMVEAGGLYRHRQRCHLKDFFSHYHYKRVAARGAKTWHPWLAFSAQSGDGEVRTRDVELAGSGDGRPRRRSLPKPIEGLGCQGRASFASVRQSGAARRGQQEFSGRTGSQDQTQEKGRGAGVLELALSIVLGIILALLFLTALPLIHAAGAIVLVIVLAIVTLAVGAIVAFFGYDWIGAEVVNTALATWILVAALGAFIYDWRTGRWKK